MTERLTLSFCFHFPLILKTKPLMPTFAVLCFAPRFLSFPVILLYFFPAPPPSFPLKVLHASIDHPLSLHPYLFLFSLLLWTWPVVFFHQSCPKLLQTCLCWQATNFHTIFFRTRPLICSFMKLLNPVLFSRAQTLSILPHLPSWVLCLVGFGSIQETLGGEFWWAHFAGTV